MTQSPMISAPLKGTEEIDWIAPIQAYIRDTFGDNPDRYAEECATLNRLRQDMRGAGKDSASGRDILYRYYAQLELLDLRFPIDDSHIKISFTWHDAFTHKSTAQYSLAFEKASVIFNIAAVLSCHGALQNRSEESALKVAYHSFQASAGMFTYINEYFLHAPSADLSRETVKTLISITLAQAQEIFLERQIADQKKVGLLAKLASQATFLYGQALEGLQESVNKGILEKVWLLLAQIKTSLMRSMASYYQALADDDANNYGVAIARLQVAEDLAKDAHRNASNFPSAAPPTSNLSADCGSVMVGITKRQLTAVQEKLASLNKDNDYIYHNPVPAEATLSQVPKMPAAKPIPVSELYAGQDISRITGPDLFSKIVPMAVTEAASLYDEEKAKLVRAESERVDLANGEMDASLDYLQLPGALHILKGNFEQDVGPDDEFRTWCDDVAGYEKPGLILSALKPERDTIVGMLDKSTKHLDMEESVCEKMRSKYEKEWTQQPSSRLTTTLRNDIENYREALAEAEQSDLQLASKLRQNEVEFSEMRYAVEHDEVDDLFRRAVTRMRSKPNNGSGDPEPSLLDADFDEGEVGVMEQIAKVEEMLKKLNLLKRERTQVLKDLKEKVHTDDISQILILNKKTVSNGRAQLFQQELEKFRPHQNRLLQANHKQSAVMRELTSAYNALLQDKRVRAEQNRYESLQRQRSSVVNRYKRAYQEFLDLYAGLQSARTWYAEMRETVQSLDRNVETFVNNRRSEGAQLLSQIEAERQSNKNGRAELERERLRVLMERMSMETPPPSGSPPKQKHKPEPLFAAGSAPRYPQTNFQGQYQPASSPPPTQQTMPTNMYAQQPYNPSDFGPNPGPASPPANQTTFGTAGGFRGASSPPPTQVMFPQGVRVATSPPPNQTTFVTGYGGQSPPPTQTAFSPTHHSYPSGGYGAQPDQMPRPVSVPQQRHPSQGFVPPPPPGPPPLGPQQTHYSYDNRLSAENVAKIEGKADPWAGLNAWK